ncbi:flagellar biosynthesis anti-sigma factor FlgM [Stutzerimonas urumqiensis]|uniref:flagellar biosynthesis anti-sigma factor FlgM n=1 Tax=Stutzerimonas urumqiensis TaxID=638269 RepID=UPI000EADC722|nr:flagellar biosynthesis anti-sigma factor FlgM [Stutzerimonas urumqiensis]
MEISRTLKPVTPAAVEAPAKARPTAAAQPATSARPANASLPLEQMQAALRSLPDLDLDKVAAIKAALARGEIDTDAATLAGHVLAHHRGSDA